MITKVKDLIKELEKLDQEAVVIYAYDEYGNNSTHGFIQDDEQFVVFDNQDIILEYDRDIIIFENDYKEDQIDEIVELIDTALENGGRIEKCIKLFPF